MVEAWLRVLAPLAVTDGDTLELADSDGVAVRVRPKETVTEGVCVGVAERDRDAACDGDGVVTGDGEFV